MSPVSDQALVRIVQDEAGGVLSVLIGQLRDFDLAEEALQEAIAQALVAWRRDGPPSNGAAWLLTVARRRAIDRIRKSQRARADATQQLLVSQLEESQREAETAEENQPIPDERLRLIFTCCHPALRQEAQVALTLRALCGLSTSEIARAYLVPETTMGQRIVRAKTKIRSAGIPYEVPDQDRIAERLAAVHDVVYLIFNEGFSASRGEQATRSDLCLEAIRLGRILYRLLPHPESGGLLALMLLHDARRAARDGDDRSYIPMDQQDRALWNRTLIEEGTKLLQYSLGQRRPGPFQIQAAISAVHAEADHPEDTDWAQIAGLYRALYAMTPSPIVSLNLAVAVARHKGPEKGLQILETLSDQLDRYQPFHAAQADLLRQLGRLKPAAAAYQRAISLTDNEPQKAFLENQLAALTHLAMPDH